MIVLAWAAVNDGSISTAPLLIKKCDLQGASITPIEGDTVA
ncbi:MAG: hypothetical protein P0Y65_18020 [Candidatus Devosia phytovorans]|uniref:Uncharacterized protein n=1 Tax=Candidatus Devosia phytovorans TaxID=3121372 RepID=A0AAJ6B0C1_9HYPH|nr:hypothetical protein [Devosia sp.]WEK04059.1 MAG: hypothetical protein P0Y65_18020 [Devosia sp.]